MTIQAVVFDFDGVLADSEPLHLRVYQELFAESGIRLTPEVYGQRYLGLDDEGVFSRVAMDFGLMLGDEEIELLIKEKARRFERLATDANVVYPSTVPCVRRLERVFPLAIASGALRQDVELILRGARVLESFRFIVAAGDTERSKPFPDPYLRAAELHGLPPEACAAIEDSRWGLRSAAAAGLRTIGVATTYRREELQEADVVVGSLDEVTADLVRGLTRDPEAGDRG
ncbi:MAG TPA: HAD family phosphatase [Vicinamibacterales bacterium]|jgi:beta-phosphoglucomutase-like phosphatase (HAD superfamily)